jgi:branched-chain amino acid transport system substrate-binding protein
VTGDTQGNPNGAVSVVRRLVEQEHVNVLVGLLNTSEVMPIRDYIRDNKVPTIFNAGFKDLTLNLGNEYLLRGGFSNAQLIYPLAEWAAANLPIKRVSAFAADFASGYEYVGAFQETFAHDGRQVVQKLWAPVGTQDFAPYLSQIDEKADSIFCFFYGGDALRLVRQLDAFGLIKKTVLADFVADYPKLLGDAGVGIISSQLYTEQLKTPENEKFVAAYKAAYGTAPDLYSALGYTEVQIVAVALRNIKDTTVSPEALLANIKSVNLADTIRGPLKFDDHQGIVENVYITQVKKVDDGYQNVVLKTIPNVSQFWRWTPEEFIAKKPYTRD